MTVGVRLALTGHLGPESAGSRGNALAWTTAGPVVALESYEP
jgi:hypothetical protein